MCYLYFLCSLCFSEQKTVFKKKENKKNIENTFSHNFFLKNMKENKNRFFKTPK